MKDHYSTIGKRKQNEDKVYIGNNIFAIFDGHGGSNISGFIYDNLINILKEVKIFPIPEKIINKIFKLLQECISQYKQSKEMGSTSLTCTIHNETCQITNLGDSRALIGNKGNIIQITKDHKPELEKSRIKKLGGKPYKDGDIWRIGNLSVSRAFGDTSNKYISQIPDIFNFKLKDSDDFILLGCDGLYDCLTNKEIGEFIYNNYKDPKLCKKLAKYAIDKGSKDNISIIIIYL